MFCASDARAPRPQVLAEIRYRRLHFPMHGRALTYRSAAGAHTYKDASCLIARQRVERLAASATAPQDRVPLACRWRRRSFICTTMSGAWRDLCLLPRCKDGPRGASDALAFSIVVEGPLPLAGTTWTRSPHTNATSFPTTVKCLPRAPSAPAFMRPGSRLSVSKPRCDQARRLTRRPTECAGVPCPPSATRSR